MVVWFPPGYDTQPTKRYPVLYMHDGRQVFDPTTSTWGKDWQVDEIAQHMILNGELEPFMVVAVDCTEARREEYAPAHKGDDYLRFLLEELKPMVDATWRTDPHRTAIVAPAWRAIRSMPLETDVYFGVPVVAFLERYDRECFAGMAAAEGWRTSSCFYPAAARRGWRRAAARHAHGGYCGVAAIRRT